MTPSCPVVPHPNIPKITFLITSPVHHFLLSLLLPTLASHSQLPPGPLPSTSGLPASTPAPFQSLLNALFKVTFLKCKSDVTTQLQNSSPLDQIQYPHLGLQGTAWRSLRTGPPCSFPVTLPVTLHSSLTGLTKLHINTEFPPATDSLQPHCSTRDALSSSVTTTQQPLRNTVEPTPIGSESAF